MKVPPHDAQNGVPVLKKDFIGAEVKVKEASILARFQELPSFILIACLKTANTSTYSKTFS